VVADDKNVFVNEESLEPFIVNLVSLGNLGYPVDFRFLQNWDSEIFTIRLGPSIAHLPNAEGKEDWSYPDNQLRTIVLPSRDADFTIALINQPLENNYYLRRVDDKVGVLSLFQMAEIIHGANFSLEAFILRNIYEAVVLYKCNDGLLPSSGYSWAHDDIRTCLFDNNSSKPNIVFSMNPPSLCKACEARVLSHALEPEFLSALKKDLLQLRKPLYFRLSDWIKAHPLYAFILGAILAVVLNVVASGIYDLLKAVFQKG